MSTARTPQLTTEELHAIRRSVFRERAQSLDEAAADFSTAELQANLARIWAEIAAAVESAPDAAFARQPDDVDGGDVWSAGQVVSHLCDTQVRSQGFWEELLGLNLPEPSTTLLERHGAQLLTRTDSLEALSALSAAWDDLMGYLPPDTVLDRRASHPAFGQAGPKGALVIFAIHMDDHLHQIRDLSAQ